jgi:hypothetical protein
MSPAQLTHLGLEQSYAGVAASGASFRQEMSGHVEPP